MTDETKKLFNAPWSVDEKPSETFGEVFDVMDEELYLHYARCYDKKTANRLARLPELYDALMEAAKLICGEISFEVPVEDACKHCLLENRDCKPSKWRELLQKVRCME